MSYIHVDEKYIKIFERSLADLKNDYSTVVLKLTEKLQEQDTYISDLTNKNAQLEALLDFAASQMTQCEISMKDLESKISVMVNTENQNVTKESKESKERINKNSVIGR